MKRDKSEFPCKTKNHVIQNTLAIALLLGNGPVILQLSATFPKQFQPFPLCVFLSLSCTQGFAKLIHQ